MGTASLGDTVAKRKGNKRSKAVVENRKPLDPFLVGVRFLYQCYLGNPLNISRNIWNVLEESVRVTTSAVI